jgi:hypothetical protein
VCSSAGRNPHVRRGVAVLQVPLTILVFPLSRANVERVFSHKNTVKYKLQDQLSIKALTEVLCCSCLNNTLVLFLRFWQILVYFSAFKFR